MSDVIEPSISLLEDAYDGAVPSGNAVAAVVLVRLSNLTAAGKWQEYRDRQLYYLAGAIQDYPMAHSFSLTAMLEVLYEAVEIICVTRNPDIPKIKKFIKKSQIAPFTKDYSIPDSGTVHESLSWLRDIQSSNGNIVVKDKPLSTV